MSPDAASSTAPLPAPPDWDGGSLLNLMASLACASGATAWPHPPARCLDGARLAGAHTLILLVLDGLGDAALAAHCPHGALASARLAGLDSLVPSTTASAITTCMTGAAPAAHGLIGWFVEDAALGGTLLPLPARRRGGDALSAAECAALYATAALWGALGRACHVLEPQALTGSAYTRHHAAGATLHGFEDLEELAARLHALARARGPARLVYAYWPELDRLAHAHGIASPAARAHLQALDAAVGALARALAGTDSVLLVTGDHGFVDVPPAQVLDLDAAPAVRAALRAPLAGEPRLAYAHLRPELAAEFPARVAAAWGERVAVWPSARLLEAGHFGPGPQHPHLAARCGEYVLVPAAGHMLIERLPGEHAASLRGVHGGYSAAERRVPLACFEARA